MKIFICALALVTLALDGYSQEWKPIITYPNKSNTTTTTSTTTSSRTNTWNTSNDITVRRKSVTYDPQYNMCVTLEITNNSSNKKVIAVKAKIHYSSSELKSVDAEDVTTKVTVEPEASNWAFLYGNPKPTYKFMTMGKIIIYFSDGTTQEIS
ncbi:hypothetical protein PZH41_04360 [Phocaeicola vulgatus]|uniref:hypothetical protein n=1 Tax=Phocaeicola vulgatus TaxID=821 RepID=UPI001C383B22|nr:hypothetical protein [Phocaeicola vulgatus]MBV4206836.1 hypothetical protein [Phocaeicola vulgatus]MBV4211082.1 hypothetical protein [Phocaeicola vulgatus]MCB6670516.1 hypothetical protein [Phocaeicola vulgatus]MCB6755175.1 hypothetical protein [Phocaeicola vulgatus]MCB6766480.1 hypothetical protein [Phocaeicola vulgatus]